MNTVARSEGTLLDVTRALFRPKQAPVVRRPVQFAQALPKRIGPTAMGLLKSTLARGVLRDLLGAGGWQQQRTAPDVAGRLWERHPQLRLDFSTASFELLCALVRKAPGDLPALDPPNPTPADRWLRVLVLDLLHRLEQPIVSKGMTHAPLCWLMRTDALASAALVPDDLDFAPLFEAPMVAWLEAAQPRLTARWIAFERRKPTISRLSTMVSLGEAQVQVLERFFAACDRAGRRDLAGFAIHAAARILAPDPPMRWWIGKLETQATLIERQRAWQAAAGLLAALRIPAGWHAAHGQTRFFDDEYDTAQLLLAQWEGFGRAGFERAAALTRELSGFHGQPEDGS